MPVNDSNYSNHGVQIPPLGPIIFSKRKFGQIILYIILPVILYYTLLYVWTGLNKSWIQPEEGRWKCFEDKLPSPTQNLIKQTTKPSTHHHSSKESIPGLSFGLSISLCCSPVSQRHPRSLES